jgi:hypothetical protein
MENKYFLREVESVFMHYLDARAASKPIPWIRFSVAGFIQRTSGFHPRPARMKYILDKLALKQGVFEYYGSSLSL